MVDQRCFCAVDSKFAYHTFNFNFAVLILPSKKTCMGLQWWPRTWLVQVSHPLKPFKTYISVIFRVAVGTLTRSTLTLCTLCHWWPNCVTHDLVWFTLALVQGRKLFVAWRRAGRRKTKQTIPNIQIPPFIYIRWREMSQGQWLRLVIGHVWKLYLKKQTPWNIVGTPLHERTTFFQRTMPAQSEKTSGSSMNMKVKLQHGTKDWRHGANLKKCASLLRLQHYHMRMSSCDVIMRLCATELFATCVSLHASQAWWIPVKLLRGTRLSTWDRRGHGTALSVIPYDYVQWLPWKNHASLAFPRNVVLRWSNPDDAQKPLPMQPIEGHDPTRITLVASELKHMCCGRVWKKAKPWSFQVPTARTVGSNIQWKHRKQSARSTHFVPTWYCTFQSSCFQMHLDKLLCFGLRIYAHIMFT